MPALLPSPPLCHFVSAVSDPGQPARPFRGRSQLSETSRSLRLWLPGGSTDPAYETIQASDICNSLYANKKLAYIYIYIYTYPYRWIG